MFVNFADILSIAYLNLETLSTAQTLHTARQKI